MKISSKGRYALRMLVDLAEHGSGGFVALKEIAERQKISKKYLEQIVTLFNRGNILKTNRGFQGGYMLARTPDKYTLGEILRLTEGSLSPVDDPVPQDVAESSGEAAMAPVWQGLNRVIREYLDGITLQDVLDGQKARYGNDYII